MRPNFCIIDDDELSVFCNVKLIEKSFNPRSLTVFRTGDEFKDYLLSHKNAIGSAKTIILLDINLENYNAFEILDELEDDDFEFSKKFEVYLITSDLSERNREKLSAFPFIKEILYKPLSAEILEKIKLT